MLAWPTTILRKEPFKTCMYALDPHLKPYLEVIFPLYGKKEILRIRSLKGGMWLTRHTAHISASGIVSSLYSDFKKPPLPCIVSYKIPGTGSSEKLSRNPANHPGFFSTYVELLSKILLFPSRDLGIHPNLSVTATFCISPNNSYPGDCALERL